MAQPVYKLWMSKFTPAWYDLTKEEQDKHGARVDPQPQPQAPRPENPPPRPERTADGSRVRLGGGGIRCLGCRKIPEF